MRIYPKYEENMLESRKDMLTAADMLDAAGRPELACKIRSYVHENMSEIDITLDDVLGGRVTRVRRTITAIDNCMVAL